MIFTETKIAGAYVIDVELRRDERGYFARAWCAREFAEHGLTATLAQANISYNERASTLRGMHFQRAPHEEAKLVRCTRGAIWDVCLDLRPTSETYLQSFGTELTAENGRALYVPEGCGHGYLTLVEGTETIYLVTEFYAPGTEGGARWDDPAFGIEWPDAGPLTISEKDAAWPDWAPE
ncbi:MAG TPA: dTDP-4-dehydrorhamnose 3,5-epimerase family protein [Gaiellaceae bacterium]|jgi:dTDP-4-dehydrorhamnose 3,5-epimerase|nr:dTDP-4-dehydrorhamnose 3,5-epimerase family protein [Gaiellaceae bacterium]